LDLGNFLRIHRFNRGSSSRKEENPYERYIPDIIRFLGYNPLPEPQSLREKLIYTRKLLGLSQEALAKRLGVDPTTLRRWERGKPAARTIPEGPER